MRSTKFSEALSCVSSLLTMACESLLGLSKFTAGLKNRDMIPQIHFPNSELKKENRFCLVLTKFCLPPTSGESGILITTEVMVAVTATKGLNA